MHISYSLVELTRRGVCNKRFNCMLFLKGSFRKSVYVTEHFFIVSRYSENPSPNQPSIVSSQRDMTVRDWIPARTDHSENYFISLLSFK